MKFKSIFTSLFAVVLALAGMTFMPSAQADSTVDVYVTEGEHLVNGRKWLTDCEPYSQTERCFTQIWGTTVSKVGNKYVQKNGWVFNNLTYKASPRSLWANNPLGNTGKWVAADGRNWRTECDTALTGGNGCRSFVESTFIESYTKSSGDRAFRQVTKEIFNNMVRFESTPVRKRGEIKIEEPVTIPKYTIPPIAPKPPVPSSAPTATATPTVAPSPTSTPTVTPTTQPTETFDPVRALVDPALNACMRDLAKMEAGDEFTQSFVDRIGTIYCPEMGIQTLEGVEYFTNLHTLIVPGNGIEDLTPIAGLKSIETIDVNNNFLTDINAVISLPNLDFITFSGNSVRNLEPISHLPKLTFLAARDNGIVDLDWIENSVNLTRVDFAGNEISDVTSLSELPNLNSIELANNNISVIDSFVNLPSAKYIDLSGNLIPSEDRAILAGLEQNGTFIIW